MDRRQLRHALALSLALLFCHHAAAQLAKRDKAPAPAAEDFLEALNETPRTVRLELLPARDAAGGPREALMMACIKQGGRIRWTMEPQARTRIRMQMLEGDSCGEKQAVACQFAIDRAPELQYVTLRGEGRKCGVFPMPPPKLLKAGADQPCGPTGHWVPLTITNWSPALAIWMTMYENRSGPPPLFDDGPPILASGCWLPGVTRMACVDRRNMILRAEALGNDFYRPAASCSERKQRDTGIKYGKLVDMSANASFTAFIMCDTHECTFNAPPRRR